MPIRLRKGGLVAALLASMSFPAAAAAQQQFVPPVQQVDERGVDMIAGSVRIQVPLASFGDGAPPLSARLGLALSQGQGTPFDFMLAVGPVIGDAIEPRAAETGTYNNDELGNYINGVFPWTSGAYRPGSVHRITNSDGSDYMGSIGPTYMTRFSSPTNPALNGVYDSAGNRGQVGPPIIGIPGFPTTQDIDQIDFATGERWTFYRDRVSVPGSWYITRLRSVVSSRGYAIQFLYVSDVAPTSPSNWGSWRAPRKVTPYNKAMVYCDEALLQECTAVSTLPSTDIIYNAVAGTVLVREPGSSDGFEITLVGSSGTPYTSVASTRHTAVSGSTVSYVFARDNADSPYVQRVTNADGQFNYTRETYLDESGYIPFMRATSTSPLGGVTEVVGHTLFGQMTLMNDELPRSHWVSVSAHPGDYRVYGWNNPMLDGVQLTRDVRNNVTQADRYPIYGATPTPITYYRATYPTECTNPRTCNRPLSVTDANNNTTDYTYAPEHGGVLTETGPSVPTRQTNGTLVNIRPQKRYEYAQRQAWVSNGSGGYVQYPVPMWLKVRERFCRTTAASGSTCAGGSADEVVTDYDYGPDSGPNNLLLRGQTVTSTDGGVTTTLRTCYSYDALGRRISETQPNANLTSCP